MPTVHLLDASGISVAAGTPTHGLRERYDTVTQHLFCSAHCVVSLDMNFATNQLCKLQIRNALLWSDFRALKTYYKSLPFIIIVEVTSSVCASASFVS
jgi:hypothetical protein